MSEREEFEEWWAEFELDHDEWRFADSGALRWGAWKACAERKQREIDELAAQVEVMRDALKVAYEYCPDDESFDYISAIISFTPSDALREIQARTLDDSKTELLETFRPSVELTTARFCEELDDMAAAIRKGE